MPYVIEGNFSKESLESMGLKELGLPLLEVCTSTSVVALKPVGLAYSKVSMTPCDWGRKPRKVSIATHKKENRKFIDHFV